MSDPIAPPELEDRPIPLWEKLTAVIYVILATILFTVFHSRLGADFWPPDASRIAPNILATVIQILVWAPVAVLLWPPFRRRLHLWVTKHTEPLHAQFERMHEQRERHHAEQMAKLEAIHNHVKKTRP